MTKLNKRWIAKRIVSCAVVMCISLSLVACNGGIDKSFDQNTKEITQDMEKVQYDFAGPVYDNRDFDEQKANKLITEFALRLFGEELKHVERSSSNVLISPASVISALGMTSYGMGGDTLTQMQEAFGMSRGHLNYYNYEYLSNISDELKMANSIWFSNAGHLTVKDEFLHFNNQFYNAEIYETAFDEKTVGSINHWIEEKTDGTIKKMLDQIPEDAVMYLINALLFEAEWEERYNEHQILEDLVFTNSEDKQEKVDMMSSGEDLFLEDEDAKGFIKYYKDRDYAFVALLPNEDVEIADYAKKLTGEHLQELLSNRREAIVHAWIPQFSYEYATEMKESLQNMGIKDAFDMGRADFTNMATSTEGNIFISRVLHKTYIEVTPVGTKAGAATVVEMNCGAAMSPEQPEIQEVHLDRPFIYMIIDCDSNTPVFIGTVNTVEER